MKGIEEFLAKFKVIPNPKDEKSLILEVILSELKINNQTEKLQIDENSVEIRKTAIYLNIHPVFKNLIFQKKAYLLDKINERFKENRFNSLS